MERATGVEPATSSLGMRMKRKWKALIQKGKTKQVKRLARLRFH